MHRFTRSLVTIAAIAACTLPALAQQKSISPHDVISTVISNDRITIIYGRPYTKDPKTGAPRKIWGGLIPFGKIWRTGADEASLLTTEVPLLIDGTTLPAGAYSIWTLPNADGSAKLIINKQVGQWGVDEQGWHKVYDQANDVLRADLKKSDLPDPVDQFTISIEKNPDTPGGGLLKLKWEKNQYTLPFTLAK